MLEKLTEVRLELDVRLFAYVVLDDHLHLVLGSADSRIPKLIGATKQRVSNELQRRDATRPNRIWQSRYHDHLIRNEADWKLHLDYLHFNPVRHGYVERPLDYGWSSLGKLVRQGLYVPDWGATGEPASIGELTRLE